MRRLTCLTLSAIAVGAPAGDLPIVEAERSGEMGRARRGLRAMGLRDSLPMIDEGAVGTLARRRHPLSLEHDIRLAVQRKRHRKSPARECHRRNAARGRQVVAHSLAADLVVNEKEDAPLAILLCRELVGRDIRDGKHLPVSVLPVDVEVAVALRERYESVDGWRNLL